MSDTFARKTMRAGWTAALAVACLSACGCGQSRQTADPVEPDRARRTLHAALDAWKEGRKIESLREQQPEIVAQDMDWKAGARLVSYEILGSGEKVDANLHCDVKLTLRDARGRQVEKQVRYIVGTSPVLTVFRQMFQ